MVDWWRGRQTPAPTAQAPAPGTAPPPGTLPPATSPPIRDGRYYIRSDFTIGLRLDLDENQGSCASGAAINDLCGYSARGNGAASFGGTFGFGYRWNDWLRTDATFAYRSGETATGNIDRVGGQPGTGALGMKVQASTLMFNLYVDVLPAFGAERSWFQPYIGAGFGPSWNHADSALLVGNFPGGITGAVLDSNTNTAFAWNAGAGLAIRIFNGFATDLGYRYVDLGDFRSGAGVTQPNGTTIDALPFRMRQHEIYIGFRAMFD
jgi:opacity protein-like surface antigen